MTIVKFPVTDRASWLHRRRWDVNASTAAAIYGAHPYCSPLRLYIEKQGLVDLPAPPDNPMMRRGRILQSAVAAAVKEERPQWELIEAFDYYHDDEINLGATPDFYILGDKRGPGVLQAKTVLPSVYQRDWTAELPPLWIVIQTRIEMMLTDSVFGVVAPLVISPTMELPHIYEIERNHADDEKIRADVLQFWKDIEEGNEPGADYGLDRELIKELEPRQRPGKVVDLAGDNEVTAALIERAELRARIKDYEAKCKAIETLLMSRMRDAESIKGIEGFAVTWKVEPRKGYTVEPSEPRVLRVFDKREDQ